MVGKFSCLRLVPTCYSDPHAVTHWYPNPPRIFIWGQMGAPSHRILHTGKRLSTSDSNSNLLWGCWGVGGSGGTFCNTCTDCPASKVGHIHGICCILALHVDCCLNVNCCAIWEVWQSCMKICCRIWKWQEILRHSRWLHPCC